MSCVRARIEDLVQASCEGDKVGESIAQWHGAALEWERRGRRGCAPCSLRQSAHRRLRCPTVGRTPLKNNAQKHAVT
ncbi:unnamed protein product [Arctia plantaginis]|uniref:Uncharacterized protein n=1 Tax=Arctia plantaginis TaxID=874455 RepID=A0A8S0ZYD4_ARCPL|nr:unnamed protein product [Arctia plantaginis]CAB3240652.1 unnamed protein product [Arctia plantaginis]